MRLARIRTEVRSQRYGIAIGALALLVAVGAPAQALEGATSAANTVAQALKIAKKADKRAKKALNLAKQVEKEPGPQGPKGDTGAQGVQGQQGPPGSDAQFNGAPAGGSLTGSYPNPTLGNGVVDTPQLADFAVLENQIETGAVTNLKIADNAVGSSKIADGTVRATDLGPITVRSTTVSVSGGGTAQNGNWDTNGANVTCQGNEQLIGGGADWDTVTSGKELLIVQSYPVTSSSWAATGGNDTGTAENFKVYALCLDA